MSSQFEPPNDWKPEEILNDNISLFNSIKSFIYKKRVIIAKSLIFVIINLLFYLFFLGSGYKGPIEHYIDGTPQINPLKHPYLLTVIASFDTLYFCIKIIVNYEKDKNKNL